MKITVENYKIYLGETLQKKFLSMLDYATARNLSCYLIEGKLVLKHRTEL